MCGIRPEFGALFSPRKASVLRRSVLGRICSPGTRLCFGSLSLSGDRSHSEQRVWMADAKLKNVALRSPRHSQKLTAYGLHPENSANFRRIPPPEKRTRHEGTPLLRK